MIFGDRTERFDELLVGQFGRRAGCGGTVHFRVDERFVELTPPTELFEFVIEFGPTTLPDSLLSSEYLLVIVLCGAVLATRLGEPSGGGTVGGINESTFFFDVVDALVEVGEFVRRVLAGDGWTSEPFELIDAPATALLADEVQDQGAPAVVGFSGGQGGGDLSGEVPVDVDAADVSGEHGLAGT